MALRATASALAATLLVLVPAASAHTAVYSADKLVRGSIGLLDEPVSTYAVTGLDVCFTQNTNATSPRPAVPVVNAGNFHAQLHAPNGAVHDAELEIPFDRPNCLTFADPLVLTQPGQYLLDLTGTINGTTIAVQDVKAGGEVLDRAGLTFPDANVADEKALAAQMAQLQGRIDALEDKQADLERQAAADERDQGEEFAPGTPAALLMLGLAGVVAVLRRKA